jgi:acyl carrier protein
MNDSFEDILMNEFLNAFGKNINYHLSLTKNDVPKWDSYTYISFMVKLERKTGITFTQNSISNFNDLNDILIYLKNNTSKFKKVDK